MKFELDAYKIQLSMWIWCFGRDVAKDQIPSMVSYFSTGLYYYMWPFSGYISSQLNQQIADTISGKVFNDLYLGQLYALLKQNGFIYGLIA